MYQDICGSKPQGNLATSDIGLNQRLPNKDLTKSKISKLLNPKRPRGTSDVDPVQEQKLRPVSKRIKSGKHTKLDSTLFQWQQLMQQRGVAISGLMYKRRQAFIQLLKLLKSQSAILRIES
ncbi:hypothetical protein BGX38DRAFT_1188265 [Terfezia claveryi]|nr:hypothetical protein BGX38DRAFT_1188265 [Terfezia claveryi]